MFIMHFEAVNQLLSFRTSFITENMFENKKMCAFVCAFFKFDIEFVIE